MPKTDIQLISSNSYGECTFYVKGVEYTYQIDGGHLEYVGVLSIHTPGKAFNFVKKRGKLIKKKGGLNGRENSNFQERESNYE